MPVITSQVIKLTKHLFDDPSNLLGSIPAKANLSHVWPEFAIWMLVDPEYGVLKYAGDRQDVRDAIERVAELYRRGGTKEEFETARAVARVLEAEWGEQEAASGAWAVKVVGDAADAVNAVNAVAAAMAADAAAMATEAAAGIAASRGWRSAARNKLIEIVNQIDRRRHRYMRLFTPHGMCSPDRCVEHERDPTIQSCV